VTDYVYSKVAVYAELAGALRLARNSRSFATDPVTAAPVNVTQGAFTASYLDTDSSGIADFTATTPGPIRLTTGATFVDVYSDDLPGLALAAIPIVAASAADAAASAADAALSASLVGAPADTAVATIMGNAASASRVALGLVYAKVYTSTSGDQTTALQAFLTALSDGDEAKIVGSVNFTTVTIAHNNVRVHLAPGAVLNKTTAATDGILVTGTNVRLEGGTITCPATFDGTNVQPTYAVIRTTAVGTTVANMTLTNVPKVGIYADEGSDLRVTGCTITGNYPAGSYTGVETGHFGIAINPSASGSSGRNIISGNFIRTCVQGVFMGNYGATSTGAEGSTISGNVFDGCHNHGIYNAGGLVAVTVSGNAFVRCQTPVALSGNGHAVTGNVMFTHTTGNGVDSPGISMREAVGCTVTGNTIKGDAPVGSAIIDLTNFTAGFTAIYRNTVTGNTIDVAGGSSTAIRVGHPTNTTTFCHDNIVTGNVVRGAGRVGVGMISLNPASGCATWGNKITGNTVVMQGECYGINVSNCSHSSVQNNSVRLEWDAITPVTLTASALSTDVTLTISSNTNFPVAPFTAILESEQVSVTASTSTTATVTRGINSTVAAAHASGVFVRLPATKTLGALVLVAADHCSVSNNDIHCPPTFGTNITLRGLWEQAGSAKNRYVANGFHGDLTKLTTFTPLILVTSSDSYLDERGIGSPSGAFFGAPGSRWSREDGGASTSLYVKETANTSATWRAV
jgi:hypothetical protein